VECTVVVEVTVEAVVVRDVVVVVGCVVLVANSTPGFSLRTTMPPPARPTASASG
jgi:hypothetical protein